MKTRMHKILALVLALVLCLGVLSACNVTKPNETTAPQAGNETTAPAGNETTAPTEPTVYEFPAGTTLDVWTSNPEKLAGSNLETFIENATGLNIDYKVSPEGGFTALLTEKVTPSAYFSTGGVDYHQFGQDGALVNLMEKKDIMPNFFKAFEDEANSNFKAFMTSENELYAAPVYLNGDAQMYGWIYRADIMEELKLEVPTDWDSFVAVLRAMKAAYPSSYPFVLRQMTSTMASMVHFCQQFGFTYDKSNPTIDPATGLYRDPYITDAARDMLKKLNFLIDEGLMDKACMTFGTAEWTAAFSSGSAFITHDKAFQLDSLLGPGQEANPNFKLGWFMNIPMSDYDHPYSIVKKARTGYCWVVTTKCPDIDLACRYIDWLYTEEGTQTICWGEEGVTFEVDADGNKKYIEGADIALLSVYSNGGNMDFNATLTGYVYDETKQMILDTMAASAASDNLPLGVTLIFNDDENLVLDTYKIGWRTCRNQYFQQFILGTLDIEDDAAWAKFVDEMKNGNKSDDIVAAFNSALARAQG